MERKVGWVVVCSVTDASKTAVVVVVVVVIVAGVLCVGLVCWMWRARGMGWLVLVEIPR